ncbi:acetylornithine deacetylase/succinyl-diaminopimelate desuccinylase family protein [Thalassobius sp. Cn5-15]|uniref:acetylornithine deacetylase/succinyl-diaminopimelate desuccinylase family protein n=1 Tax=Thalassobius sp. Cn5-15 TaxID=2917763 RepID=UPI001EF2E5D2|nr:acetylornithine deacetylase/succinyl-diaminopimelate desuccinylase family protein [Thalassobius sp. Cn5-15]MCG7494610.1 acetylornithine deacetylase/succinyl-diaminopimelate desuccinylase family protein [Thalassobius sp. Cn5-15]
MSENDSTTHLPVAKSAAAECADLAHQLARELEQRRDELILLTQDLIRIPTLNPPGDCYRDICDYLAKRLKNSGFSVEMIRAHGTPGDCEQYPRWNVVARREGGAPGECVHFNSHIDVVDVGRGWTTDPFGGELKDGKIYGRGACDMKGGLAASIVAVEAFLAICPEFHGAIEISGTADEESGGFGGVAYLAQQGYFAPTRVQHVIIPEPLNKDRICLGHRGVWWAEIETFGEIAHGSMPFLGDCAVRHMGAVVQEMEASLFPALAQKRTDMPVVPEGAKQSTLNINSLHGGQAELPEGFTGLPSPVVPDSCRMVIDRRFLIEEDIDAVQEEVMQVLRTVEAQRDSFRYEVKELHRVLPTMTQKTAPVVETVAKAIAQTLGKDAEYVVSPGTYDQKHIDRIGKLHNCIAYGPGILDLAHKPDEYVGVEDMLDSANVMGRSLIDLLVKPEATA